MPDFFEIKYKNSRNGITVFPDFKIKGAVRDLMVQGKDFYAVWNEEEGLWSRNEFDVQMIIDAAIDEYVKQKNLGTNIESLKMCDYQSGIWKKYKDYIKNMPSNNYHQLDTKIVFANDEVKKSDYISRKLPYDMKKGSIKAYDELMSVLYEPEERKKLEWAIGAIITGDSKKIQKFIAITGEPGKGKGTFLNILASMFDGYVSMFNAKELANGNNAFAGDAFANNPLIAIQTDGDLSRIQDNTLLNSIVSHEKIIINEKYKSKYEIKLNSFLFMATNGDIAITDYNSGIKRRLIDVSPSNRTVDSDRYDELMEEIENEKGAIAYHCLKVYEKMGKDAYKHYISKEQESRTNIMYNFVESELLYDPTLKQDGYITATRAYQLYKDYCEDSGFKGRLPLMKFKTELKHYFHEYSDSQRRMGEKRERCCYIGLKTEEFDTKKFVTADKPVEKIPKWLDLKIRTHSLVDDILADCPAQYQDAHKARPQYKWINCKTKLSDIDTTKLHFVKPPLNHIVIDFDLKDGTGEKSDERNLDAAKDWPKTYAEFSKSGAGIHLHYIYDGDPERLSAVYDEHVEVKVFKGDSSLRRKLTKCNDIPLAHLKEGDLPLKEKNVLKTTGFESIRKTENVIKKALRKENTGATATEVSLIKKVLDDAYESGVPYDLSVYKANVISFAANSSNQSEKCLELVSQMHFMSDDCKEEDFIEPDSKEYLEKPIAFYDIEVLPNLFVICWKVLGQEQINEMINPHPDDVYELFGTNSYRWVGFNNLRYDNIIVRAWMNGNRTNKDLYELSRRIIVEKDKSAKGKDTNAISYTDIYDYAKKKQKLKKWEIDLGIHHQELGLPWDQPVPKEMWKTVADYCCNDVRATEAVWNATQGDFLARKILAEIAGGTPNMPTNTLSTMFIFEGNNNPQSQFNYRFMGEPEIDHKVTDGGWHDGITYLQDDGKPVFVGYDFNKGKSSYLDVEEVGEGGYVYAEVGNNSVKPKEAGGMYGRTITLDVASMHPSSVIAENLFGDYYTKRFKEILDLRIAIKHGEFDKAKKMFDGKLSKYLDDPEMAGALADALKIVINSVYGLTSAKFDNAFRDKRNVDNIVAKRGALFMINLRNLVQQKGYTVVHIKTDSIKIADPDDEIIKFVTDYGKAFGYNFEVEHIFEKICLVNNAVYIAKLAKDDPDWKKACKKAKEEGKPEPTRWTATGDQFAVPYVFKTLFSKADIEFKDLCETKSVNVGDIYLDFNESLTDVSELEDCKFARMDLEKGKKLTRKQQALLDKYTEVTDDKLDKMISKGHEYRFVGKVGLFCPVVPGVGGGIMYRNDGIKNFAVTGTKGWLWKEAEVIENANNQYQIDYRYFDKLVDDAKDKISQYGDYEWFVS